MALANVLDDVASLDLSDVPDAVRAGRRFVHDQLLARGAVDVVDDATMVTAELLRTRASTAPLRSRCR